MGAKSKYVIVEDFGLELPIVFNPILQHKTILGKVVSAGFCSRKDDGSYSVWGHSVSLKINSRPEDAEIIKNYLEKDL